MCEEKPKTAGQRSRHRTMRRAKGAAEAPPPACDWPAALPRSAPRYRSLFATRIGKGVARLWPFGEYNKKWPNNQAMVTASASAPAPFSQTRRDGSPSPRSSRISGPRGICVLKYFWRLLWSLAICSDIPRSRHHRSRRATLGMPSVAKMGPSTADTGQLRPTNPP